MPRSDYAVGLSLSADARQLRSDLQKATREWQNFGRDLDKVFAGVKRAATVAATSIAAGLTASLKVGSEFEDAISDLSAITGATGDDLKQLSDAARDLAKVSTLSASQTARAFKLVASAKPDLLESADALTEVTEGALTLAEAARIDLGSAAAALGNSLNQFRLDASETERVINTLAAGAKLGASSIEQTTLALRNAGTAAAALGVSFEQANAAVQVLASIGITGAQAGTSLRNLFLILEGEGGDLSVETHGLIGALENLQKAQLSTNELMEIFGRENVAVAQAMIQNVENLKALEQGLTGTNIAFEQANINTDNLRGDLAKLRSAIDEALIAAFDGEGGIGAIARDVVQGLTDAVTAATSGVETAVDRFVAVTRTLYDLRQEIGLAVAVWATLRAGMFAASVIATVGSLNKALRGTAAAIGAIGAAGTAGAIATTIRNLGLIAGAASGAALVAESVARDGATAQGASEFFGPRNRVNQAQGAVAEAQAAFDRVTASVSEASREWVKASNNLDAAIVKFGRGSAAEAEARRRLEPIQSRMLDLFDEERIAALKLQDAEERLARERRSLENETSDAAIAARAGADALADVEDAATAAAREAAAMAQASGEAGTGLEGLTDGVTALGETGLRTREQIEETNRTIQASIEFAQQAGPAIQEAIREALEPRWAPALRAAADSASAAFHTRLSAVFLGDGFNFRAVVQAFKVSLADSLAGVVTRRLFDPFVNGIVDSIVGAFTGAAGGGIGNPLGGLLSGGASAAAGAAAGGAAGGGAAAGGLFSGAASALGSVGAAITSTIGSITGAIGGIATGIVGAAKSVLAALGPGGAIIGGLALFGERLGLFGRKVVASTQELSIAISGADLTADVLSSVTTRRQGLSRIFGGRGTRTTESSDALEGEALAGLSSAFQELRANIAEAGALIGAQAGVLDEFATQVQVNVKGLSEEQQATEIAEAFARVANELSAAVLESVGIAAEQNAAGQLEALAEQARAQEAAAAAQLEASRRAADAATGSAEASAATNAALGALTSAVQAAADGFRAAIQGIAQAARTAADGIAAAGQAAANAAAAAAASATAAASSAASAASSAAGAASSAASAASRLDGIPGFEGIPQFQSGGIVPGPIGAPTLALVHGGETVIPTRGAAIEQNTFNTFNISQSVTGDISEAVLRTLETNAEEVAAIVSGALGSLA